MPHQHQHQHQTYHGFTPKYFVFAGNYREFANWRNESAVKYEDAVFVNDPTVLLGLSENYLDENGATFIIIGTFHLRKDAKQLMEVARAYRLTTPFYSAD